MEIIEQTRIDHKSGQQQNKVAHSTEEKASALGQAKQRHSFYLFFLAHTLLGGGCYDR